MAEFNSLREKIAAEKAEKMTNHERWFALLTEAVEAGYAAGAGVTPTPMVVGTPKNLLGSLTGGDDGGFDTEKPLYYVSEGACGFGWVALHAKAGTEGRRFVNYLTGTAKPARPDLDPKIALGEFGKAGKAYGGGHDIWVWAFGQSVDRKQKAASAAAAVLNAGIEGLSAYGQSRLD